MQDEYLPAAWRIRARRSRPLLLAIEVLAAVLIGVSQWIDLAWLLHISPGFPGRFLMCLHADWVSWITEWFSGAALLVAIARIIRMMGRLAEGEAFSAGVSSDLRGFAFWILIATVTSLVVPLLVPSLIGAIWHVHPSAEGAISGNDMLVLLMSGILFQVSRLLEAAQQLADDHEQII